jgi:hypothetical protein
MWNIFGIIQLTLKKIYSTKNLLELCLVQNLQIHGEICFRKIEVLSLPCEYTFLLMNFIVSNRDNSKDFHLYTVLIQVINLVFIVQLPNFHVFRKNMPYAGIKLLNNLLCRFASLVNQQAQFRAVLRRYFNTQFIYSCLKESMLPSAQL